MKSEDTSAKEISAFAGHQFVASQLYIHPFCLLCDNGYGPCNYFYFVVWHDV